MKLYVYADESGSVDPVAGFVIAVAICAAADREDLISVLLAAERATKRGTKKWTNTPPAQRRAYLEVLPRLADAMGPFYWRRFPRMQDVAERTAILVVDAVRHRDPADSSHRLVIIDGLTEHDQTLVRRVLSKRGMERRRVIGGRDESTELLRLADSLAGFLRHVQQGDYAVAMWPKLGPLFHEL